MKSFLEEQDIEVSYYIPNRIKEGYGVKNNILEEFKNIGYSLVITVDTGITAVEEAKFARSIGLDMIITDHHEMQEELPEAVAVVDLKRKDIEIRLYDEKRQKINLGDIIILKKEPELNESFKVKVVGLLRYENFEGLFEDFGVDRLANKSMKKSELLEELEKFYTKEKQKEYGVLGIRIEKVRN